MGLCLTGFFLSMVVFFKFGLVVFVVVNLIFLGFNFFVWMKDVCIESFSGYHNFVVDHGFKIGFLIFVGTEVMFFFSIFWAFFDKVYIGNYVWWPSFAGYLDFLGLPLLGTLVLLSSGLMRTWSHNSFIKGGSVVLGLSLTLFLGLVFLFIQFFEYNHLFFNMSDGWAGSLFYFSTGFHGFHVILGVILLFMCLVRFFLYFFSSLNYFFFEGSVIY